MTHDNPLRPVRLLIVFIITALSATSLRAQDIVVDWNRIMADTIRADTVYQNPGMASRTMAMMNLAIYDAVNEIEPRYQPFYQHDPAPQGASAEAAGIQAAYRVLSSIYTDQQALLDSERANLLLTIPDGPAKTTGLKYGDQVGKHVVNLRADDGFDNIVNHIPSGEPGHWEPDPENPDQEAWGPLWGELSTFGIQNTDQFFPPEMPAMTSQQYTDAFNEVISLGAKESTTRTDEQTEIGLFWAYDRLGMGTPIVLFNQILRTIATNEGNDLLDNSKMFAMAATSMADAGITAWDSKFVYDFWRPISGIRRADEDENPDTSPDREWVPLGAPGGVAPDGTIINDFTPPFPTYVSGHASFGAAMFEALAEFYGTDAISFEVTSEELSGTVRSFDSLSAAAAENGRSRVYLGIHWFFDDTKGQEMGVDVSDYIAANYFQVIPEPTSGALLIGLLMIGSLARRRRRGD